MGNALVLVAPASYRFRQQNNGKSNEICVFQPSEASFSVAVSDIM